MPATENNSTLKNLLVLGGGGFIGNNVCRSFAARGYNLRVAGRTPPEITSSNVTFVSAELARNADYLALLEGQDAVVHLVSGTTPANSNQDMQRDIKENLLPTVALLEACKVAGTRRVVFMSSGGAVYGPGTDTPTPETAQTNPISAYGVVKLSIEKFMHMFEQLGGPTSIVLRVANPFGPYQRPDKGQGAVATFGRHISEDIPISVFGDGSVTRDFVYVDDVVEAVDAALRYSGDERVFNIGSGVGRTILEVIASLEQALGKAAVIEQQPARPVDVPRSVLCIERASRELDWQPKMSWSEGLQRTMEWMSAEYAR